MIINRKISMKDFLKKVDEEKVFFSSSGLEFPLEKSDDIWQYFNHKIAKADTEYFLEENMELAFQMIYCGDCLDDFCVGAHFVRNFKSKHLLETRYVKWDIPSLYMIANSRQLYLTPTDLVESDSELYIALKKEKKGYILLPVLPDMSIKNISLVNPTNGKAIFPGSVKQRRNVKNESDLEMSKEEFLDKIKDLHAYSLSGYQFGNISKMVSLLEDPANNLGSMFDKRTFNIFVKKKGDLNICVRDCTRVHSEKKFFVRHLKFGEVEKFRICRNRLVEMMPVGIVKTEHGEAIYFEGKFRTPILIPINEAGRFLVLQRYSEEDVKKSSTKSQLQLNF